MQIIEISSRLLDDVAVFHSDPGHDRLGPAPIHHDAAEKGLETFLRRSTGGWVPS